MQTKVVDFVDEIWHNTVFDMDQTYFWVRSSNHCPTVYTANPFLVSNYSRISLCPTRKKTVSLQRIMLSMQGSCFRYRDFSALSFFFSLHDSSLRRPIFLMTFERLFKRWDSFTKIYPLCFWLLTACTLPR